MENMNEIVIDDGCEEYVFRNKFGEEFARFAFNPTDTGLVGRYDKIVDVFDNLVVDENDTITAINTLNEEIMKQIDVFCNSNVSAGLFGKYSPLTLFANGDFYCEVALEKIVGFIEQKMKLRVDKKKAKIRKDIAKNKA